MAHITVDGTLIEVKEGELLIEELLSHKIEISHFCYHPSLGKDGNCRMCMVEIEGQKRPQIACDTPVKHGMIVRTKGANIDRVKRSMLELELINHPIDCPVCDQAGECSLQNYYMDVGLHESRLTTPKTHGQKRVDLGANVVLDQERCVLCTRCVRFTKNITKTNELGVLKRADHSVITTFPGSKLSNPYAMNVVDLCPVGALTSQDFRFHKRVWFLQSQEAICNGCARGCSLFVDHHKEKYKEEKIYRYRPRFNEKINGYFICDAGRLSYTDENEKTFFSPLIRGKVSEYEYAQSKLLRLLKRHLNKTLVLIGAHLSLEEMARCVALSQQYALSLSGYGAQTIDESFGDTFLKSSDKTPNARAFGLLGIDTTLEFFQTALDEAELIVMIGREDVHVRLEHALGKNCVVLSSYLVTNDARIELLLPIASHMSKMGSYINVDGYVQHSQACVPLHPERQNLLAILAYLLNDSIFTCKEVWDLYVKGYRAFSDIEFDTLFQTPKIIL
jgi:NADH-quinone oxidoreductase subunit G